MITVVEFVSETKKLLIHNNLNWREFDFNPNNLYWWDLNQAGDEEAAVLRDFFHFQPLAIQDCIADIHYPKIEFYESYLYLVVHGVDIDRSEAEGFIPKE